MCGNPAPVPASVSLHCSSSAVQWVVAETPLTARLILICRTKQGISKPTLDLSQSQRQQTTQQRRSSDTSPGTSFYKTNLFPQLLREGRRADNNYHCVMSHMLVSWYYCAPPVASNEFQDLKDPVFGC